MILVDPYYPGGYSHVELMLPLEGKFMCSAVTCRKCGKTTWAGCGQHVDQVMRNVPKSQQCQGHAKEPSSGSFFSRLFGR